MDVEIRLAKLRRLRDTTSRRLRRLEERIAELEGQKVRPGALVPCVVCSAPVNLGEKECPECWAEQPPH